MYNALSADYDKFVNWKSRLAIELPFIIEKLHEVNAKSVLDAATGTGMHAIALAQCGFTTAGTDLSPGMIERARANARSSGVQVRFEMVGFGDLAQTFGQGTFDAIICLGNSLPHLLTPTDLSTALADFATCLKPGGCLLIQNRNFDFVMAHRERWMEPQSFTEADNEWIFLRFYDFDPDSLISFNMITLKREAKGAWNQYVTTSRLRPLLNDELVHQLQSQRFTEVKVYGNMAGIPFDPETSQNLVVFCKHE